MADEDAPERDESRDFDPRYDPAFQRGYHAAPGEQGRTRMRGAAPGTPAATASPAPAASPVAPRESGESVAWEAELVGLGDTSAAHRDSLQPSASPAFEGPYPQAVEAATPAVGGVPVATAAPGFLDRIDASPRTNRRILALWLVGGGFVVLGIVLYVVSVFTSYTNPTPNSDVSGLVFSQLGWMLAGPLVTVGLATLVTLILLAALTARRSAGRAGASGPEEGSGGSGLDR